jgi:hypothetical protein
VFGMGGNAGTRARGLRVCLLVAVSALFALIPAAQASAATEFTLTVDVEGEGFVFCEAENEEEGFFEEECGESESATETKFLEETEVSLVVFEEAEYEFSEFKGDCSGGTCDLVMDEDHEVTVVFAPEPVNTAVLDVTIVGDGKVECELESGPEACQAEYAEGTELTLIAKANSGSEFIEFAGDCEGQPKKCELTMDEDKFPIAVFEPIEGEEGEEEESGGGGGSGGGSGSPSGSQSPPPPSSPAPLGTGKAKVAGFGLYKGGRAMLRISCKGGGPCKGTVKLIAKLKAGHRTRKVVVGKASFSLPAGGSRALKIKLSSPAKKLLGKGRTLTAKVRGSGVTASTVKIKPTER